MTDIKLKDKFDDEADLHVELDTESETFDFKTGDEWEGGMCELSYESSRILANWILENIPWR